MSTQNATKMGVATATIVGMNAMIGSGVFSAPAAMAANVGPAGILTYAFVVFSIWFMALSLARLAKLYPQEGSFYTYAKPWGGHAMGVAASSSYFIGLLIAMGLLAQMAGSYLRPFFPSYDAYTLGLIALFTLTVLNMFGVVLSKIGQYILIVCTTFPLVATTIMCFSQINLDYLTPFAPFGMTNVLDATRIVIFGFFGFECAASLFNVVENPEKNVPRALTYSIIIVGTLYILFITSIILSTPLEFFSSPNLTVPDILARAFPEKTWLINTVHIAILSAILGTVHSMILSSSNLLITIINKLKNPVARNLVSSGRLNIQTAVLFVATCIFTSYVMFKDMNLFFNLTAMFIVFAYIASLITLLTLKNEWESGQNIKTLLGIGTALVIFFFAAQGLQQDLSRKWTGTTAVLSASN